MRAFPITAASCLCLVASAALAAAPSTGASNPGTSNTGTSNPTSATALTVPLPSGPAVTEQVYQYQCGPEAVRIGLPAQPFPVTYLDAGDNHIAFMDIHGARVIFVGVGAGSQARFESGRYTWWDSPGRGTFLAASMPSDLGGMQSVLCQRVAAKS